MDTAARPEPRATGWLRPLAYAIAVPADILKFFFMTFIFSAPFFAAVAVDLYLSSSGWPSWAAGLVSAVVGGGALAVATAATPITLALMAFGTIMATLIGFTAWLILSLVFVLRGINPFHPRYFSKTMVGWFTSIVPFLNLFPTITIAVWRILHAVRKADAEALAKWESQNAEREAQIVRGQEALALAAVQAQAAANANDEIPVEEERAA